MNVNEVLTKLKVMLSSKHSFAEAELIDGVSVYTEGELEAGAILFVRAGEGVSEDPFAPAGKHETTDGKIITVGENGEITDVTEKAAESAEEEVKEEVKEEVMEEVEVEVPVAEEVAEPAKDLLEGVAELIAPFVEEIATLTEEVVELKKRFEKMAAEPAAPRVKNTFADALADKNKAAASRLEKLSAMRKAK